MSNQVIEIRKGESIFIDFPIESDASTPATIPATMTASYKVIDGTGQEVENNPLVKSSDEAQFELKITDTITQAWEVGSYTLDVLVDDSSNGYADYILEADIIVS